MTENNLDFWTKLRFEITNSGILGAYCDWIEPKCYYFQMKPTIVEGNIGFLASDVNEYKFKLTIDEKLDDSNEVEAIHLNHWTIEENSLGFNGNTFGIRLIRNLNDV